MTFVKNALHYDKTRVRSKDVAAKSLKKSKQNATKQYLEPITPKTILRRSTKVIRASEWYSPSLHYLLLTD